MYNYDQVFPSTSESDVHEAIKLQLNWSTRAPVQSAQLHCGPRRRRKKLQILEAGLKPTAVHMDETNVFWRQVWLSNQAKIALFGHNDKKMFVDAEVRIFDRTTPNQLWGMAVTPSCCGTKGVGLPLKFFSFTPNQQLDGWNLGTVGSNWTMDPNIYQNWLLVG